MKNLRITPSLEKFQVLAKTANLVALSTEVSMDLDTPVSVYYKLVGGKKGFILESVDTSQQNIGRYSFIGAEPFVRLQVFRDKLMIKENDLMRCIDGEPADTIKQYMASYQPAVEDTLLPLSNGGLVGYLNYEIVSTFDRVRGLEVGAEELLGQFMLCRVMVVFDQLKNSARLIYLAGTHGDLAETYAAAREKMAGLLEKLAAGVSISETGGGQRTQRVDFLQRYGKPSEEFLAAIGTVKAHIFAGDIFQAVPSKQFREKITKPPSLFYRRLRQVNPSPYMFYLNFEALH